MALVCVAFCIAGCLATVPATPVTPSAQEEETSDPGEPIADVIRDARREVLGAGRGSP
jgi:hypothetical protein